MAVAAQSHPALRWDGGRLRLLDQTLLPAAEAWIELQGADDTADAIRRLAVRGAPLIGVAAAYGLAMEVAREPGPEALERGWRTLRDARPTAVNLAHAVDRVRAAATAAEPAAMAAAARAEAERIHAEEDAASTAIAILGADLLAGARRIATHCNTGALAAGGRGTALAVILALHERAAVHVLAGETRPLLQGARLTAWELARAGVPHELVVDGAMAGLIRRGEVDAVVVGCDRVAANGDTANKVGTYPLALAARAAGIPFVVAGPTSTIDPELPDGEGIAIEERDGDEIRVFAGAATTAPGTAVRNPAFDVTPAALIDALVTERGVARPPDARSIGALLAR
ncbi:MAG: methylthioribose-phosphate isomerase [Solirubrobacteraceae bacterium]|jgi:methylthioribose-1-phosphate isomerase|nr:methylthioribose-phosphate isomerase [Solirubrobacteraceae bacterium]